ncbi:MAG: response regulator [Muribaculaceae bacterium]|nr:response regulator [Muribaculaceae bacterium]
MNSSNYGTILIVDDNPAILTALKICLGKVFEKILTLTEPENILITLRQEHVDVILLDMNFSNGVNSGQDGMIWLSSIKRRHPDIPVVLITAYADVKLAVRGLKNGAADFVTKPWDNDELIRVLKDAIDKSKEVVPLHELEREHIKKVVDKCHGNMSKAADMLGITRQTLYRKYQP